MPTAPMKYSMPSMISAFASAFLIVSHTGAASLSFGIEMVHHPQRDACLAFAIRCSASDFGTTSR